MPTLMIKSPFSAQPEYVTKEEFEKHDLYMRNGFDIVIKYCDSLELGMVRLTASIVELRHEVRDGFKDLLNSIKK